MPQSKFIRWSSLILLTLMAFLIFEATSFCQETSVPYMTKTSAGEAKNTDNSAPTSNKDIKLNTQLSLLDSDGSMPQTTFGPISSIRNSTALQDWNDDQTGTGPSSTSNDRTPLSGSQKLKYGFKHAFLRPEPYLTSLVSAAWTESRQNDFPPKRNEDRIVDGLSRWAINFGNGSARTLLVSGALPAVFHEDPRYKPSGRHGFKDRTVYAISRVFETENDTTGKLQPNYSRLIGGLGAAVSTIFGNTALLRITIESEWPTFSRYGWGIGWDVVQFVVLNEFGPDLKKKFLHR